VISQKPKTLFKAVNKSLFRDLCAKARVGKTSMQYVRDVHEGNFLRQCTVRSVEAYSAAQAIRFLAFLAARKQMLNDAEKAAASAVVPKDASDPFAGTVFADNPKVVAPEEKPWLEPNKTDIAYHSAKIRASFVMIPDVVWRESISQSTVAFDNLCRNQFSDRGKSGGADRRTIGKKTKATRDSTMDLPDWANMREPETQAAASRKRRRFGKQTDEEVMKEVVEKLKLEHSNPALPVGTAKPNGEVPRIDCALPPTATKVNFRNLNPRRRCRCLTPPGQLSLFVKAS